MTIHHRNPSIHAEELRSLLVAEFPFLQDSFGESAVIDPHRLMRVVFDYTSQAINARDVPTVVKCFRFTKRLLELDEQCDIFVQSAIWASFIHRFPQNDPVALEVFQGIDPQIREALFSPFAFPHSWLAETEIKLSHAEQWQVCLTVNRPHQAEIRFIRQTGCPGHFAVVKLSMEPMLENRSVVFRNRLDKSNDAPLVCLNAEIEGITQCLARMSTLKKGVSYLRIDLIDLRYHPVDSRMADFVTVAAEAVERCFAQAGFVEL